MVKIKQNKMVIDRTKKFRIERVENEIYSFLHQKSNQNGTYKGFTFTQEERERMMISKDKMWLDLETSVDEWFNQYTFDEKTTIIETYRVHGGFLLGNLHFPLFDTEHTWFVGILVQIMRDIKLNQIGI